MSEEKMTKKQIDLISHAVGGGKSDLRRRCGYDKLYRRHFCATQGSEDDTEWKEIAERGWATANPPNDWLPYNTYIVTREGFEAWREATT